MSTAEPIVVVLGAHCSGTSAVCGVLHHLGVFMGETSLQAFRELPETWEETHLDALLNRALSVPDGGLQMTDNAFRIELRSWVEGHRRASRSAGRLPGAKNPRLCLAVDAIRDAWGPILPVVVHRPTEQILASLNRLDWFGSEQNRVEWTARLIEGRDLAVDGAVAATVDFEELLADPAVVVRRLAADLGLDVTEAQIAAAVDSVVRPDDPRRASYRITPDAQATLDHLTAAATNNPEDGHAAFELAEMYFRLGDFVNARKWYKQRLSKPGLGEDAFCATYHYAETMTSLNAPWEHVEPIYQVAVKLRPTRAEPLYAIARHYADEHQFELAYQLALQAARIPFPKDDRLAVAADVYSWRAAHLLAMCALQIGRNEEAFGLLRLLLDRPDRPDGDVSGPA